MTKIRWGILSTGHIAGQFAASLAHIPGAELVAVGSRHAESAQAFGEKYQIPHRHASYEALAQDKDVDVIYVATPHNLHYANARLCLEAGKGALVEKAFTLNAGQAASLIALAREKRLFLMEAMWDRFLPHMVKVRELVSQGILGDLRLVTANLGFRAEDNPQSRLLSPSLAGGALLDVGCYVVSFASMLLGQPDRVAGVSRLGRTGVDEDTSILLGYPQGRSAALTCAVRTNSPQDGYVIGVDGWVHLHPPFGWSGRLTLHRAGQPDQDINAPIQGSGYAYEAREVSRCLDLGLLESPVMPLDESLGVMRTLDALRQQAGLHYPEEVENEN